MYFDRSVKLPETFAGHSVRSDVFLEDYLIPIISNGNDVQTLTDAESGSHRWNVAVFIQDEVRIGIIYFNTLQFVK